MQERGENIPPEDSFEVARKVKEMHCYTCSDIVKVVLSSVLILLWHNHLRSLWCDASISFFPWFLLIPTFFFC